MAEIREYKNEDIPALVKLWTEAFGDSEELAAGFFSRLRDFGSCTVMEDEGKIIAMASVIAGQELQYAGSIKKPVCGYIYGVAVDEKYRGRGFGKEISRAALELAKKREAQIVCVKPATEPLYGFYAGALGFETALFRERHEIPASDAELTMKLNATEYNMMREDLLKGKTYLRLSYFAMDYEQFACEQYGGGLFASMSGICVCTADNGICTVYEIISENPEATAASVASSLGCSTAVFYTPSESGEPFIMAEPGKIPQDTVWNIAYE